MLLIFAAYYLENIHHKSQNIHFVMKKIGILFGQERSFPHAFIDRVNGKNVDGILAEPVTIDKVVQGQATEYAVIIDRISQDVPFYRAYLKNAAASGCAVINNPFWWSADEKFFNNVVALKTGVPVPNTVLLPSKDHPTDTTSDSFSNLAFPMDWEAIFEYIGFPAYMKPHSGGGWKNVYKLNNANEFFEKYAETEQLVMLLQSEVRFESYFRIYCIGGKHVRIMHYEPRNPHHLRYAAHFDVSDELMATMHDYVLRLNHGLGYDFNTVELAISDGVPYAIDFGNPAPDADINSVGQDNFEWVVETAANYAIERAQAQVPGQDNLTWGSFIREGAAGAAVPKAKAVPAKKKATPKTKAKAASPKKTASKTTAKPKASKTSLLSSIGKAAKGKQDDLKQIKGIGPKLETMLNDLGIKTYGQVAKMKKADYEMVDELLNAFKGRGQRDNWSAQAKKLLK